MKTKTDINLLSLKEAPMNTQSCNPGQIAGKPVIFGEFGRYKVYPVHTRFGNPCWMVSDAENMDEFGMPQIIRQESSKEKAMDGLI